MFDCILASLGCFGLTLIPMLYPPRQRQGIDLEALDNKT